MRFSIIIPVYNAERFFSECVASVQEQTYPVYEIILINDGSTDSSGILCDAYHAKEPDRIKVIHTVNQGALAARAVGIQAASGDILVFLDADDRLRHDAIQILNSAFEKSACDLIIFNGSTEADYSVPYRAYPFQDGMLFSSCEKEPVYRALISSSILNNVCLKAAKRSVFCFDLDYSSLPRIRNGEDLLLSAQMLTFAQSVLVLNQNLYYYRQNEGSVVHSSQLGRADSIKAVHQFLQRFTAQWKMPWLASIHNARKVHGWIEALNLTARELTHRDFFERVQKMSEDPYFRVSYEKMDPARLNWKYRLLAKLLYHHRYRVYCMILSIIY